MIVFNEQDSEIELITSDNEIYSSDEINTGNLWYISGVLYPIYRKVLYGLTLHAGKNVIYHHIENLNFITDITGTTTLKNGIMQIIPESCCDNITKYGISVRDISKTNLTILMGTGYTNDNEPAVGKSHIIIKYTKN